MLLVKQAMNIRLVGNGDEYGYTLDSSIVIRLRRPMAVVSIAGTYVRISSRPPTTYGGHGNWRHVAAGLQRYR